MVTDVFHHFLIIGKETINMKIKQKNPGIYMFILLMLSIGYCHDTHIINIRVSSSEIFSY